MTINPASPRRASSPAWPTRAAPSRACSTPPPGWKKGSHAYCAPPPGTHQAPRRERLLPGRPGVFTWRRCPEGRAAVLGSRRCPSWTLRTPLMPALEALPGAIPRGRQRRARGTDEPPGGGPGAGQKVQSVPGEARGFDAAVLESSLRRGPAGRAQSASSRGSADRPVVAPCHAGSAPEAPLRLAGHEGVPTSAALAADASDRPVSRR